MLLSWLMLAFALKYTDCRGTCAMLGGDRDPDVEGNTRSAEPRTMALLTLLGAKVDSDAWRILLKKEEHAPEVRKYTDMHYYNLRRKGVSLQVKPDTSQVVTIDLYNAQARWGSFDEYPLRIPFWNQERKECLLTLQPETTALELVRTLGEPSRKGGAEAGGPTARALGPAMWTEWTLETRLPATTQTTLYILAEYAGEAARAKDRWEPGRGSTTTWATIAISIEPAKGTQA